MKKTALLKWDELEDRKPTHALVADVEVDDETGEVRMIKMDSAYEVGRALNPKLVE